MKDRGIIIRILPHHAQVFRDLWKGLRKAGIAEDFGASMNDAIYSELQNLQLRWQDAINDAGRQTDED